MIANRSAANTVPRHHLSSAMKTSIRWLFLLAFTLLFVRSASAVYDPRLGRWLSRDPLGEEGGLNLYAYCGNDPVNRHDPLGLDWIVANGHLYWGENQQRYIGSSMGNAKVYRDLGPLAGGYDLTSSQLAGVQGVLRDLLGCTAYGQSVTMTTNEDLLKTIMLLQGFFPERVNELNGGIDPRWVIQGVDGARTLANPNSLISGPSISQLDVDPIIAYSNSVWANSSFSREHPVFMRMASTASTQLPYAAIGLSQFPRMPPRVPVAAENGAMNAFKGIPESPRVLPPSAESAFTWTHKTKIAGLNPISGQIRVNPTVWKQLTPGQQSTVFWEEFSHQSRVLGRPMWMRYANARLYQTSLGKFVEETMARTSAMGSFRQGIGYGWNYPGVNKGAVILEGTGVVVVPGIGGYYIGDSFFDE